MTKLTTIILVHKNIKHLHDCLESLCNVDCDIVVGITSNNSEAFDISEKFTKNIYYLSFEYDFSKAKNELLGKVNSEFVMFMQPNEILIRGGEDIIELCNESQAYRINLLHDNVITKPVRLWHKNKNLLFQNPVYEYVKADSLFSHIFFQYRSIENFDDNLEIIQKWQEKMPLALEPLYYKSCFMLSKGLYDDYINTAKYYLFKETNKSMSYFLTKYYLGTVYCYVKKDYQNAIKCALECITQKPLMAEYWCLLGDIYYSLDNYDKAYHFYQNAKILGSRRLKDDEWPFHIDKYKDHPDKMMLNCQEIMTKSKQFIVNKQHLDH